VQEEKTASWFEGWFNTPFYHDLYRHRDDQEAIRFIAQLCDHFQWKAEQNILDVCCGNGRHALEMERRNLSAWGVDLSERNIQLAQSNSMFPERWWVQDIRKLGHEQKFDFVLNLFTSFGYFETDEEHREVLKRVQALLQPQGTLVLDFLNLECVVQNLVATEVVKGELTDYQIQRHVSQHWISKEISFVFEGQEYRYCEKVRAFRPKDLMLMLESVGFRVRNHWGDYSLNDHSQLSPRCIFVVQKPSND
jgi:SAM-dependent methyltransferase